MTSVNYSPTMSALCARTPCVWRSERTLVQTTRKTALVKTVENVIFYSLPRSTDARRLIWKLLCAVMSRIMYETQFFLEF